MAGFLLNYQADVFALTESERMRDKTGLQTVSVEKTTSKPCSMRISFVLNTIPSCRLTTFEISMFTLQAILIFAKVSVMCVFCVYTSVILHQQNT